MSNATLSRAQFQVFAAALARTKQALHARNAHEAADTLQLEILPDMAAELAKTNPKFDQDRFVQAVLNPNRNGAPR